MGMGMKDTFNLIDVDSNRIQTVRNVRPRINQVDFPLIIEDACHTRSVDIPSVSLTGMHHREVFPFEVMKLEFKRRLVVLTIFQIQIHIHRLAQMLKPEHIHCQT